MVQYIDDRFAACPRRTNFDSDVKTQSQTQRDPLQMACLIVTELTTLGYTLAINKSKLVPTTVVRYLGFNVDSCKQAYYLPSDKKKTFIEIRETILKADAVDVKTLQWFAGKCVSMAIAIPGANLYRREVNFAISQCTKNSTRAAISKELRQELEHWRFIDEWVGYAPWRQENIYRYPLQQMHPLSATVFLSCQERRKVYLLGIFGQTQMIDLFTLKKHQLLLLLFKH